ncbi:type II toxin-antitoxin system VapC family toxin [Chloroflexota bacterium]
MIVVDTNVLAYFFLKSDRTPLAEQALIKDTLWCAPVLWRSEFRNVLALYMRQEMLTLANALRIMDEAAGFMQAHEYTVSSMDVLRLVADSACSADDCAFVALAQALGCPLVTDDRKVLRNFPDTAVSLQQFVDA